MTEETAAPAQEASSVASGIEDAKPTPASAGKNEQPQPDNQEAEQPKEPEKFSRQHKVYLKQQAEFRKQQEAFENAKREQQAEWESKQANLAKWQKYQEAMDKGDPWTFLHENKLDLDALYKMALQDEPQNLARKAADELDKKYEAKFAELERQRQEQEDAAFNQKVQAQYGDMKGHVGKFLQANPEQYELTMASDDPAELVMQVIWQTYAQSDGQTVLEIPDAINMAENWLEEQEIKSNKLFQTQKAKKYLLGKQDDEPVTSERKKSASHSERRKQESRANQSNQPRTLSNKMQSATPANASGQETFKQRKERLIREMSDGTWKPKNVTVQAVK